MDLRSNIHGYYKQDHKSSVSSNIELTFSRNPNLQWIYQTCKYFKALGQLDCCADSLFLLTIVILIILRSFALCAGVASGSGSRHCTICTVYLDIWYGEKKNIESRLFFRS